MSLFAFVELLFLPYNWGTMYKNGYNSYTVQPHWM